MSSFAQLPTKVVAGQIIIGNTIKPDETKYTAFREALKKKLELNPRDTTSLFFTALLLEQFNNQLAKPTPGDKTAFENLLSAKEITEQLFNLKMQDFRAKILRAQIYKDLTYRYVGDESWKFNNQQIANRRSSFNDYKKLANEYYDELINLDRPNAYDYEKLKVTGNYSIR